MSYKGIAYLRRKLSVKRVRILTRYKYYEMKETKRDPGKVIPQQLKDDYYTTLGWCAKAVDSLADRLSFNGFENDNFDLTSIFNMNNPDVLIDSAILSALISSCCFIYISPDADGDTPHMQVIDGANATGISDPLTGMLTEGYAVLKRDSETDSPLLEAYFVPGRTDYINNENHSEYSIPNAAEYPLLVPIIYRPDAKRPFGHSRISRACMNLQDKAKTTLTRADITAEFYSFPQKYAVGLSDDIEVDSQKASISSFLQFSKDEDGDHPTLGQFTQQNMEPHISQFKMYAAEFGGETGLTLDDMGFATENPSSAEAIKACHENLRLTARKAQRTFGSGFLNAGFLASCVRDNYAYKRRQVYLTRATWAPIFEPDAAMLSGIGDGAIKINQAIPGYFGVNNMQKLTGIEGDSNGGTAQPNTI